MSSSSATAIFVGGSSLLYLLLKFSDTKVYFFNKIHKDLVEAKNCTKLPPGRACNFVQIFASTQNIYVFSYKKWTL